jgi:ferritin
LYEPADQLRLTLIVVKEVSSMIGTKMQKAISDQIVAELYSSYLYLSMAANFEQSDLPGFATWMKVQAQEETTHAMKFFDFVHERGGEVNLGAIDAPPKDWDSPLAVFKAAYEHECKVSGLIADLVHLAREEKDIATEIFLQWFVTEQVEEEASADAIVRQLQMIGDAKHGLFMLDRELGNRVFTPETAGE